MTEPAIAFRPPTAFDSARGREAALKRWAKRKATEEATAGRTGTIREGGEGEEARLGLLARDTLATIAADTSAPHASRVAAARALGERTQPGKGGRELDPVTIRRLIEWAEERIPLELVATSSGEQMRLDA